MKIGAFTTTYDEVAWVKAIAPQLDVFDEKIVVAASSPLYWQLEGEAPEAPWQTMYDLCADRRLTLLPYNNTSYQGAAKLGDQRQLAMEHLRARGCDAVAWFAPDELFTIADAIRLREALKANLTSVARALRFHTLWWNEHWEVSYWPPLSGLPIDYNCFNQDTGAHDKHPERYRNGPFNLVDATCWHFAFARPEDEMYRKFHSWGHADGKTISEGHWKHWNEWEPGKSMYWPSSNDPPVRVKEPLPDEIKMRLGPLYDRLRKDK